MRTSSSSWVNYFLWKCERHIPTSKVYPEIIAKCPACGFPRPAAEYRPSMFPDEPVVKVVPPVEVKPPAPVVATPTPEDLSRGQAQRDLDEAVVADLPAAAKKLKKSRVKAPTSPAPEPVLEPPPVVEAPVAEEKPSPVLVWVDGNQPEPGEKPVDVAPESKRPKDIPNSVKSKAHMCPAPKCRKVSRRNSPYCSKICSDRSLRLRRKSTEKVLTDQEIKWLNRILAVLEVWGSDKG